MNYPEYVKIGDKKYKINTDFRVAIECNQIAEDENIKDYERALGIIYKLFGDDGLNDMENYNKLLELGLRYLRLDETDEIKRGKEEKITMDFVEDEKYIKSSFKYDYKYDPYSKEYLHWWEFYNDLKNLSNSELGDCCILNRVRALRELDLRTIKDKKERDKLKKAQEQVALKKYKKKKTVHLTEEQEKARQDILKKAGLL